MHNYKQSKKQVAVRFFTYGVLTVAVLVLSAIGILFTLGYQFNFGSGNLEQTALVKFDSQPSGASVTLDAKPVTGGTATSANVSSGSHTADMTLSGYRTWQKTFSVTGGTVLWLDYALLVPTNLKTASVHDFTTITSDQTSPDKKWRLVTLADKPTALSLVNISDPKNLVFSSTTVSSDVLTKAEDGTTGSLSVVSWDSSSRYALIKHIYGANTEYLRYDRQNPSTLRNITKELGVDGISKIGFSDASGNTFYALVGTDLRKLDLGSGTISQPLVTGVTQMYYNDGGETVAYARVENGVTSVGVYRDAGGAVTTATYDTTPTGLQVSYGEYYGYRYMATYHDGKVSLIQSPDTRSPKIIKTVKVSDATWLYFSPEGRMLVAQTGNSFMTYDLETGHVFNETLGANDATTTKFTWLDDYHLMSDAAGEITMSEFDGSNQADLGAADAGSDVALSNNSQWFFSIKTVDSKAELDRTALRI